MPRYKRCRSTSPFRASWKEEKDHPNPLICDVLCPMMERSGSVVNTDTEEESTATTTEGEGGVSVKQASLTLILSEIASTKPLVR